MLHGSDLSLDILNVTLIFTLKAISHGSRFFHPVTNVKETVARMVWIFHLFLLMSHQYSFSYLPTWVSLRKCYFLEQPSLLQDNKNNPTKTLIVSVGTFSSAKV